MVGYRSTLAGDLVSPGTPNNFGTVGLQNLGNTCYMNSILQCMNGSIPLARYFLDGSYKMHINKENPHGSKGVLVEAFATVVKHLWEGKYKFVSPLSFKVRITQAQKHAPFPTGLPWANELIHLSTHRKPAES